MLFKRRDRRVDEARVVAGHRQDDARRQRFADRVQLPLHAFDDVDRVLAGGATDVELHRGRAVQPDRLRRPREAVLGIADVRHFHRRAAHRRDDDVVELVGGVNAAERPQQDFGFALLDRAARHLDVLALDRVAHLRDREPVGIQFLEVDHDVDFARATASERHFSDAVDRLDAALDVLVRNLGERPQAHRIRGCDDRHDRIRVRIDLLDHRWQDLRRHVLESAGHFLADVAGRVVDVALEHELDRDLRAAFVDPLRRHFVDAGDAAERFLHRLDDGAGHFIGARARQLQRHRHRGGIGLREQIDAEIAEREDAQDDEAHDEHRGEDRTANAQL